MKKIVISTMLLAFAIASFGQLDTAPKPALMQADYLKKSKTQKTVAWIFLGTGVALFTGGMIAHYNHVNNPDDFEDAIESAFFYDGASAVAFTGILIAGGSIPFFIVSSKNKKKAHQASVFINMEKAQVLQGTAFNNQSFPAVGFKIRL
jgi:hypothetical protein